MGSRWIEHMDKSSMPLAAQNRLLYLRCVSLEAEHARLINSKRADKQADRAWRRGKGRSKASSRRRNARERVEQRERRAAEFRRLAWTAGQIQDAAPKGCAP